MRVVVAGLASLVAATALLMLCPPAQALVVDLEVDPLEGHAPLQVSIAALTPEPEQVAWWLHVSDGQAGWVLDNGTSLPAHLTVVFQAGEYQLQLTVDTPEGDVVRNATVRVSEPVQAVVSLPLVANDVLPVAFAGLLMLGLAGWLLVRDPSNRLNIAFALLFTARGLADLTHGLLINGMGGTLTLPWSVMERLHPTVSIVVVAAAAHFLLVYLAQNSAKVARLRAAVPIAVGALVLVALAWWRPDLYWGTPDAQGGILFAFNGLHYPIYTIIVYLLVRESRREMPDDRRSGAFYSAVGFLFLPAFVGAGEFLFVDVLEYFRNFDSGTGIGFAVGHWAAVLSLVPLALAGWTLLRAAREEPHRHHTRLHAGIFVGALAVAVGSLALPLAAYAGEGSVAQRSTEMAQLFWIFQGVWAIPYAVLVAWGLTRYQASAEQSRMRRQLRRFGLATVFFTIFFAVSEGLEGLAASRWGNELGLLTAAVLTIVLGPVQERLQKRLASIAPEQETSQEVRFYEEQLRRTLLDGTIGEQERKFLGNLRVTMGISDDTAQRIEARLLQERRSAGF